jgi:hypothetical protein
MRPAGRRCGPIKGRPFGSPIPSHDLRKIHSLRRFPQSRFKDIFDPVSISCFFGRHRPLFASIVKRQAGYSALCDRCGLPIERADDGRWTSSEPLLSKQDKAA